MVEPHPSHSKRFGGLAEVSDLLRGLMEASGSLGTACRGFSSYTNGYGSHLVSSDQTAPRLRPLGLRWP